MTWLPLWLTQPDAYPVQWWLAIIAGLLAARIFGSIILSAASDSRTLLFAAGRIADLVEQEARRRAAADERMAATLADIAFVLREIRGELRDAHRPTGFDDDDDVFPGRYDKGDPPHEPPSPLP